MTEQTESASTAPAGQRGDQNTGAATGECTDSYNSALEQALRMVHLHGAGKDASNAQQCTPRPAAAGQGTAEHSGGRQPGGNATEMAAHIHPELLERRDIILTTLNYNTQLAAEMAVKQSSAATQVGELIQDLFRLAEGHFQDRQRLTADLEAARQEGQWMGERCGELEVQLELNTSRSSALQTSLSALQSSLEAGLTERQRLEQQVGSLQEEVRDGKDRAQQLQERLQLQMKLSGEQEETIASLSVDNENLTTAKSQLQSQIRQMMKAERELTRGLKEAHEQIEKQMAELKEEVRSERRKREALRRQKKDLVLQYRQQRELVTSLNQQIEKLKAALATSQEKLARARSGKLEKRKAGGKQAGSKSGHTTPDAKLHASCPSPTSIPARHHSPELLQVLDDPVRQAYLAACTAAGAARTPSDQEQMIFLLSPRASPEMGGAAAGSGAGLPDAPVVQQCWWSP